ncbi:MAG: 4-(cytidine 5'-diphospho)-2-C-methyl-D-erythritol kinase [Solirubrobacterales bacterium]
MLRAPAKLNLSLRIGAARPDDLHELRSLFCALALADRLVLSEAEADGDEVECPGVEGPNLVAAALGELRARGWRAPPVRVEIDKRIPVAAGLGGGSADAGAILRHLAPARGDLAEIAGALGADVPSQLDPGFAFISGAGEVVEPLPAPAEFAVVLIPGEAGLSAGDVYAEADRLGLGLDAGELDEAGRRLMDAAGSGASPIEYAELLVNDLQGAALSLRPEISEALVALEDAGAARALVTGSGPTAFGLFADIAGADAAASRLPPRFAGAIVSTPQGFL